MTKPRYNTTPGTLANRRSVVSSTRDHTFQMQRVVIFPFFVFFFGGGVRYACCLCTDPQSPSCIANEDGLCAVYLPDVAIKVVHVERLGMQ